MLIDIILIFIGALFVLVGLALSVNVQSVGPLISYGGIVSIHFTSLFHYSYLFLLVWFFIVLLVLFLRRSFVVNKMKKYPGSIYGERIATFGLLPAVFFLIPYGLVLFPFILAFIVELFRGYSVSKSLKLAIGSFVGFISGMGVKVIISLLLGMYFFFNIYDLV